MALLQYYSDDSFGYDIWDESKKLQNGISVEEEQRPNESSRDFFYRIGKTPRPEMYCWDFEKDKLCNDEDWHVRSDVAKTSYGLDKLVEDPDEWVRVSVAKQRYCLGALAEDESKYVREEVARQGGGLTILVNDDSYDVRIEVAKHGFGLDKLVYDESYEVRAAVASCGYGLNILANDISPYVRKKVSQYLQKNKMGSLADWELYHPFDKAKQKAKRSLARL